MNTPTHFTPSSHLLNLMLTSAEAKFETAREQARLRAEVRKDELLVRAISRAVRGRLYDAIQEG